MRRSGLTALCLLLALAGCGSSDKDQIAQRLESYYRSVASGDAQGACAAFTAEQRRVHAPDCGRSPRPVSTPPRLKAARIQIRGDQATAYLRAGDCVLRASRTLLERDASGTWKISAFALSSEATAAPQSRCVSD